MNAGQIIESIMSPVKRLLAAENGAITIVTIVFFVTIIGIGGLAIDLGRLYGVHGQMQAYVDNASLAGANELNGTTTSTTRALRAVLGDGGGGPLVDGFQNFAEGDIALSIDRVRFLSALGDDLPDPTTPTPWPGDVIQCTPWVNGAAGTACTAAQSAASQFIEVVATERQVNYIVLPVVDVIRSLVGGAPITDSANVSLMATAGYVRELCNNIPLMMCNPSEVAPSGGQDFNPIPGQLILAKSQGAPVISPGNFGALAVFGNGASDFAQGLASTDPNTGCIRGTVPSEPGAMTGPFEAGMNVRMDIFQNGGEFSDDNGGEYAPAEIVTKGLNQGASCGASQLSSNDPDSMPFPRHPCFGSDVAADPASCHDLAGDQRISGTVASGPNAGQPASWWDRNLYTTTNYGMDWATFSANYGLDADATRHEVYEAEIANKAALEAMSDEAIQATCGNEDPTLDDRRILLIAIVDCLSVPGGVPNGRADIPFDDIAEVFITEPVGNENYAPWSANTTPQDIFVEIVGKITPADSSGVLHVFPVLYR